MSTDGLRIPEGSHARRVFAVVILGSLALLGLIEFAAIPAVTGDPSPSFADVLDETLMNVIATVLGATLLGGAVVWLLPTPPTAPRFEHVPPKEIGPALNRALNETRDWQFMGSAGRWFRAVALPTLARRSRQLSRTASATAVLLDPLNEDLVAEYATYRAGVKSGTSDEWTPERVRRDIFATVVCAYGLVAEEPQLEVRIFVKPWSSILRYDMGDEAVVVTREDPSESGLKADAGTFLYETYRLDIQYATKQSRALDPNVRCPALSTLDVESTRALLTALQLGHGSLANDEFVEGVLQEARSDVHPYG